MSGSQSPLGSAVYLVHHAAAVGPKEDPQQPLSLTGRMAVDALALEAKRRGVAPAAIWHSGKLRARQTGEAFWRACNPLATFRAVRGLQPGDPPEWVRDQLLAEDAAVMIVGHMPHLPALLRLMTVARGEDAPFPPHGLVCLARETDNWVEQWRIEPGSFGG